MRNPSASEGLSSVELPVTEHLTGTSTGEWPRDEALEADLERIVAGLEQLGDRRSLDNALGLIDTGWMQFIDKDRGLRWRKIMEPASDRIASRLDRITS